ncbi:MAG: hypothetical protein IPK04_11455 [Bdellovibrionales bacterium]|nr:hypothetical protein [Bdellovibrionales bacterium]
MKPGILIALLLEAITTQPALAEIKKKPITDAEVVVFDATCRPTSTPEDYLQVDILKGSLVRNIVLAINTVVLLSGPHTFAGAETVPQVSKLEETVQIYRQRQIDATSASVLKWLKDGNSRFAIGRSKHGGFPKDARERLKVAAQRAAPACRDLILY